MCGRSSPEGSRRTVSPEDILFAVVEPRLAGPRERPLMMGLCGAQGSGKSTVAAALAGRLPDTVVLSLDDFYLTREQRSRLAAEVHPLFATRGVPGTHDLALALETFAALDRGDPVALPKFDKAMDDRIDPALWPTAPSRCRLIIFEGWCVGATPQPEAALANPVNRLERDRDPMGIWRRHANEALAAYQPLFARMDTLALLRAPDWETVLGWRIEQEHALRRSRVDGAGIMDDGAVAEFVSHYERLTRHILNEMPGRADLLLQLAHDRSCVDVRANRRL
jgi:D-glycerate 3-kinase